MAATVRDDSIPRSIMFLCLGVSALLLVIQWRAWASNEAVEQQRSVESNGAQKTAVVHGSPQNPLPSNPVQSEPVQIPAIGRNTMDGSTNVDGLSQGVVKKVPVSQTNLVVDLSDRRVFLYDGKKPLASYPLAVGKDGWETPTGTFKVLEMQKDPEWLHPITKEVVAPGPDNPLGKRWIGFLIEGQTHIGFHGTNQEKLIGQAVSHGCLRMRNSDVIALYEKVAIGTQVTVRQ